jgi:hypothetical protein
MNRIHGFSHRHAHARESGFGRWCGALCLHGLAPYWRTRYRRRHRLRRDAQFDCLGQIQCRSGQLLPQSARTDRRVPGGAGAPPQRHRARPTSTPSSLVVTAARAPTSGNMLVPIPFAPDGWMTCMPIPPLNRWRWLLTPSRTMASGEMSKAASRIRASPVLYRCHGIAYEDRGTAGNRCR